MTDGDRVTYEELQTKLHSMCRKDGKLEVVHGMVYMFLYPRSCADPVEFGKVHAEMFLNPVFKEHKGRLSWCFVIDDNTHAGFDKKGSWKSQMYDAMTAYFDDNKKKPEVAE